MIDLPNVATIISLTYDWANPLFNAYMPIIWWFIGAFAGFVIIQKIFELIVGRINKIGDDEKNV